MSVRIVVLSGNMGSGKDTIGDILSKEEGYTRIALADELKRMTIDCLQINPDYCFGPSSMRSGVVMITSELLLSAMDRLARHIGCYRYGEIALFVSVLAERIGRETSVRWILQRIGTEWGRAIDPFYWTKRLRHKIKILSENNSFYSQEKGVVFDPEGKLHTSFVITDARFRNEIDSIPEAKAYWIDASKRIPSSTDTHASEPTEPLSNLVIDNNGTIDDLRIELRKHGLLKNGSHP